jgi:hypothetical protein
MALAADAHVVERHLWRLQSTLDEVKFLRFRVATRRPAVSKREGQNSDPLKTVIKEACLGDASESLMYGI